MRKTAHANDTSDAVTTHTEFALAAVLFLAVYQRARARENERGVERERESTDSAVEKVLQAEQHNAKHARR